MSKWSNLQQIANVAEKITLLISSGKKACEQFCNKKKTDLLLFIRLLLSDVVMLAPSTSNQVHNFIVKTLTDHLKKFNFNKMLSMIHYAGGNAKHN